MSVPSPEIDHAKDCVIVVDRSVTYDPKPFFGENYEVYYQNQESLAITELHLCSIEFVEFNIEENHLSEFGFQYFKPIGHSVLDLPILEAILRKQEDGSLVVPELWKGNKNKNFHIYFEGTILRDISETYQIPHSVFLFWCHQQSKMMYSIVSDLWFREYEKIDLAIL